MIMSNKLKALSGERHAVRKFSGFNYWFIATEDLDNSKAAFDSAILTDVTFDPRAKVMEDIFCGSGKVSEAEAVGVIHEWEDGLIPEVEKIERSCLIAYDVNQKCFHAKDDTSNILTEASMLLLHGNGQAEAIWLKPVESKQGELAEAVA